MEHCLINKLNDCKNCFRCLRKCPIKSVSFLNDQSHIIYDDCIYCGKCYLECPQKVIEVRNDINRVKRLIKNNEKVVISLAPSFISYYSQYDENSLKEAIKKLGFYDVEETAIGATIVKKAYDEM
jgi:Fe-S-cluster-containing hydrogenase component 2